MSELYASVLMIGVTISLGSVLVAAALGSIGQAQGAASLGASVQQSASGRELSLAFAAVAASGSCPAYRGGAEGTTLTLALFDYGASGFAPVEFVVNSTVYPGTYPALSPGTMGRYTVSLGSCAHSTGQTVTVVGSAGDEVQVES
ncbi:MAG: hypothetical protein JRN06_02140 [Nitrososphaerota archaeon]|nr:hypothetical protein [Nitrososphaerota archaeon]MDG7023345.1 hypothetical protein [Nitrososphaerota archaeon]